MTSDAEAYEFAMRIATRQLETRDRSEHELRSAMVSRKVPAEVADQVVARLKELRYVDDHAFAQTVASNRVRHSGRGRSRIRQELAQKGVDKEAVEAALGALDPEQEWEAARAVASKRMRSLSGLERHVALRRLQGALARRGFSSDIVLTVAREFVDGDEQDDT